MGHNLDPVTASRARKLFSTSFIRACSSSAVPSELTSLSHALAGPLGLNQQSQLRDLFENCFEVLKRPGNRDDYVYRSAVINKQLLGRHNLRTTTLLSEFRVGRSKADLVLLNGEMRLFEIKSERDSLKRLRGQIEDFSQVFSNLQVITSPEQVGSVIDAIPSFVGVSELTPRFHIREVRSPSYWPYALDAGRMVTSLRMSEAKALLSRLGAKSISASNTEIWTAIRQVASGFDIELLHREYAAILKSSRSSAGMESFMQQLPQSLTSAAISAQIRDPKRQKRLLDMLSMSLGEL